MHSLFCLSKPSSKVEQYEPSDESESDAETTSSGESEVSEVCHKRQNMLLYVIYYSNKLDLL